MSTIKLGVIGYGSRARFMLKTMCRLDPGVKLVAVADPQPEAEIHQKHQEDYPASESVRVYPTADAMLDDMALDGIVIGTRCSLHATMALKVLARGIPLYLEKPIATNMADLAALRAAANPRVVVSFPLRSSALVRLAKDIIDSGRLGAIEHVQAVCNVPYGATYYQNWYRDENETGGMFLQKATHDFDYINHLLEGNRPEWICAMTSKQVFRGNHPAGLHCMDCPERTTCFESPYHPSRSAPLPLDAPSKTMCAFAVDTGNEDSGSALIQYESGMHVSYSQNFYSRRKSAKRGARLIGYKGTLEFDWSTDILTVMHHNEPRVETHTLDGSDGHGGGDALLAANFLQMIRGEAESISTLDDGLLSGLMCLQARESALTRRFEPIAFPTTAQGNAHYDQARMVLQEK